MSFVERAITLTITLGATPQNPTPTFDGTSANRVRVEGLRTSATIIKAGGKGMSQAQVRVYGLDLSVMNKLSTLGIPILNFIGRNEIIIEAGDNVNGLTTVFEGTIYRAWADLNAAPDAAFNITAQVGMFAAAAPTAATSFPGVADVPTILSGLAARAGLNFQNDGVTAKLASPYFSGSVIDQIKSCAAAARISHIIDNGTLAIWPEYQWRGALSPVVSPSTGMMGYPTYTDKGIAIRTLFNPSIGYGSRISVESVQLPAIGTWVVYSLVYDLEAQMPNGRWFTELEAARPGIAVIR